MMIEERYLIVLLLNFLLGLAILFMLGWRPYVEWAVNYFFAPDKNLIITISEFEILGFGGGGRHPAKHGGYEGGRVYVVVLGVIFGIWRDPYRSRNSGDYNTDKGRK